MTSKGAREGSGDSLRVAIVGFGSAGRAMVPYLREHEGAHLVGIADPAAIIPHPLEDEARAIPVVDSLATLLDHTPIDAVYIASPTELHLAHALEANRFGLDVILEKPMAASVDEANQLVEVFNRSDSRLVVGHSHSFEPPARALRYLVESGIFGRLQSLIGIAFTDWMYRPRRPDDFDPSLGGGVTLRQGVHHCDVARWIAGGRALTVDAQVSTSDPGRGPDGAYQAFVRFEDRVSAQLAYSGHDHFHTSELTGNVDESGVKRSRRSGDQRQLVLMPGARDEKPAVPERSASLLARGPFQSLFGFLLASFERADVRTNPEGLTIDHDCGRAILDLSAWRRGRHVVLDELILGRTAGTRPLHDGAWGRANLELAVGVIRSSDSGGPVQLTSQVPTPRVDLAPP